MRFSTVLCGLAALTLSHALPTSLDAAAPRNSSALREPLLLASRDIFTDMRGDGRCAGCVQRRGTAYLVSVASTFL